MQYSEKLLDCELFVIITKSKFSTKQKQCKFTTIEILFINAYRANAFTLSPTINNARDITYTKSKTGTQAILSHG